MIPPDHLSPRAKEYFLDTVRLLTESKAKFGALDIHILASYAACCAQIEKLDQEIDKVGYIIDTPKGKIANPLIRAQRQAVGLQVALAKQLGLTPSARGEVKKISEEGGALFED